MEKKRVEEIMQETIIESKKSVSEDKGDHPMVGAILADKTGMILERAHRGDDGHGAHAEYQVIKQAKKAGIDLSSVSLFVTMEPCTAPRGEGKRPCAIHIKENKIPQVYFGMLDTHPSICGRGEKFLRTFTEVERFPHRFVQEIEDINKYFSRQWRDAHLHPDSIYVKIRISLEILNRLRRAGVEIEDVPYEWDVTLDDLEVFCTRHSKFTRQKLKKIIREARALAFDKKYAEYSYEKESDPRFLGGEWKKEVRDIFHCLGIDDFHKDHLLDVGIGNGFEAVGLFDNMPNFTGVDIGRRSIKKARTLLDQGEFLENEAENLKDIKSASQEIYVSLRTYQSAYFDIDQAIREAYRVVRPGGIIVVSISSGHLDPKSRSLIPGITIPRSSVVDRDRPFELIDRIRKKFTLMRFKQIGITSGFAEIYIYGMRGR